MCVWLVAHYDPLHHFPLILTIANLLYLFLQITLVHFFSYFDLFKNITRHLFNLYIMDFFLAFVRNFKDINPSSCR